MACASGQADIATLTGNSDKAMGRGQKALQKKEWINARQHFRRIVDGFPQSPYAAEARLAVGEPPTSARAGSTNDLLAVGAYREFLTLYPSHPRSDFAQFQVAEAYFRRKNRPDRDQTDTREAVGEFQRLLDLYPQSTYGEAARARIVEALQSLARAEFLAGYFYQRTRELRRASIARYRSILKDYPDYRDRWTRCSSGCPSACRPPGGARKPYLLGPPALEEYPNSTGPAPPGS